MVWCEMYFAILSRLSVDHGYVEVEQTDRPTDRQTEGPFATARSNISRRS